ncbi:MAG TPA: CHAT domain-containing protein [Fulvivirga sp.]|nr:CHAT domain-containing protein [Fulvivirga sp.]
MRSDFNLLFGISVIYLLGVTLAFGQGCPEMEALLKNGRVLEAEKLIPGNEQTCPNIIGQIYLRKGRNDLAELYFDVALEKAVADSEVRADALNNLGLVYWNTGNAEKAKDFILEGLKIRLDLFGSSNEKTAASYNDLGLVLSAKDPDAALDYYEKALEVYRKIYGENNEKTAQGLINSGIAYRQLELFGDATINFEKALEIWRNRYPDGHPNEAFIINNIGRTEQIMGNLDGALVNYEKALKIFIDFYGNKHPEVAGTLNLIGNIHNSKGEFNEALDYYQKALVANCNNFNSTDLDKNPSVNDYLSANTLLNSLYYKSKAFADLHYNKTLKFNDLKASLFTLQSCDTLIDNIRQLRTNEADKLALGQLANTVYETGVELCKGMGDVAVKKDSYYELSFYFAEKSKSAVLLEAISDANAKSFAGISADDLDNEKQMKSELAFYESALVSEKNDDLKSQYSEQLLGLRKEYADFIVGLETKYPEYYALKYDQTLPTIQDLQSKLNDNETLLSYFLTSSSKRVYIFEINKNRFKIQNNLQSENLSRYISGFSNSIYFKEYDVYLLTANQLYNELIPKRLDKNTTHLIIVPSGRLSTIPFEALLTSKPKNDSDYKTFPYLINDANISYYYSSTLYFKQKASKSTGGEALLCAPIHFASLPDLPGTEREIEALETVLKEQGVASKTLINSFASEQEIKTMDFSNYKYLHFATHGIVNERDPSQSKIFLNSELTEDGNLYSGEIYNLNLKIDLVTLSACETGLGQLSEGEGVIGLSRALLYAGANNIVVSLWKVSDQSTSDLMIDFYSNNKGAGYSLPLQMAKRNLINTGKYAEPYYWAPFILIGE